MIALGVVNLPFHDIESISARFLCTSSAALSVDPASRTATFIQATHTAGYQLPQQRVCVDDNGKVTM